MGPWPCPWLLWLLAGREREGEREELMARVRGEGIMRRSRAPVSSTFRPSTRRAVPVRPSVASVPQRSRRPSRLPDSQQRQAAVAGTTLDRHCTLRSISRVRRRGWRLNEGACRPAGGRGRERGGGQGAPAATLREGCLDSLAAECHASAAVVVLLVVLLMMLLPVCQLRSPCCTCVLRCSPARHMRARRRARRSGDFF